MKKASVKLLAVLLSINLLLSSTASVFAFTSSVENQPKYFGIAADPHLFPESLIDPDNADFQRQTHNNSKLMGESEAILKAMLETAAQRKTQGIYPMDYLLIPGDLTFNGEKPAHIKMAAMLRDFENSTGIQAYVINGNHDVNNYGAQSFTAIPGRTVTAKNNPALLLTKPDDFKAIYAEFGYNEADSTYQPSSGKAGKLSYAASLPGGYRLIAFDSCKYTADVTSDGEDDDESDAYMTPGLLAWVLSECRTAVSRGETVIGMTHGNVVEHFEYQSVFAGSFLQADFERISYELADAGMHFVFTGHNHMNDTASIISGNNEIIYDFETCGLTTYPNIYREVSFDNTPGSGMVNCIPNNVACDAQSNVDISGISDVYGVIQKPFCENYAMPMLYGGSIEQGISHDGAVFINSLIVPRLPGIIKKALPRGIAGMLDDKDIDFKEISPAFTSALETFNLSPAAFAAFLDSVIAQVDEQYILNTTRTTQLAAAAVERLAHFELAEGNEKTELGKVLLLVMCGMTAGDENPLNHPELIETVTALRTQAGADRLIEELLDIVVNDMLFDEILPSISLNELDSLLPAQVMLIFRAIAGDDLTVGGVLDKILDAAAKPMKDNEFFKIETGRDVLKDLIYVAGYPYLNAESRLRISKVLADAISSLSQDNNCKDSGTPLPYNGKTVVIPTAKNFRLPVNSTVTAGGKPGDAVITWHTMLGIEGCDIELNPLPAGAVISVEVKRKDLNLTAIDLGFMTFDKSKPALLHTITICGLEPGVTYHYRIGDKAKGLMAGTASFEIDDSGEISHNTATGGNRFFAGLLEFILKFISGVKSVFAVFYLFP